MIQSPSLSVLSLIPAAGDMPMPALPEGAELPDFGALLAQSSALAAAPVSNEATTLPQAAIPTDPLAEPAMPGNPLPPVLPFAVPVMEPEHPASKLKAAAPDPADLPPVVPLPLAKTGIPVQSRDDKGKGKELPDTDTPPKSDPGAVVPILSDSAPIEQQPVAAAFVPVQPMPVAVSAEPDQSEAEAPPHRGSSPQPVAPALDHAAPQAASLRQAFPARSEAEQAAPLASQAAQSTTPAPAAAAPQPIAQVRIELAPAVPVMRALAKDEPSLASAAPLPELPIASVTTGTPTAAATAPVPLAHQPMPLADRPQDFSALIDRLVAAREAAGPQAVAVSVAHADFGQVHLRFRQDEAGLSVAMASADPAFARAASAMPPVLPISDAQSGQFQNAQRQDSSAATGQSSTGQQRGSTSERQGDQPHSNHTPRHAQPEKQQRRAGIFA